MKGDRWEGEENKENRDREHTLVVPCVARLASSGDLLTDRLDRRAVGPHQSVCNPVHTTHLTVEALHW